MMHRYARMATLGLVAFAAAGLVISARAGESAPAWGTIKGQVVFGGAQIPEVRVLNVDRDVKICLAKGPLVSEDWVINKKNRGVRWVFVWLDPPAKGAPIPIHPSLQNIKDKQVSIDQPCCMFAPHALGMRQGQELVAKNPAPIAHNVHWTGVKNPGDNISVRAQDQLVIKDLKADKYPIKFVCDIHPWMNGWVRVFEHPYFAVTDADGKFEIKNAPAGAFRLMVWQETVGYLGGAKRRTGTPINIPAGGTLDLGKLSLEP